MGASSVVARWGARCNAAGRAGRRGETGEWLPRRDKRGGLAEIEGGGGKGEAGGGGMGQGPGGDRRVGKVLGNRGGPALGPWRPVVEVVGSRCPAWVLGGRSFRVCNRIPPAEGPFRRGG